MRRWSVLASILGLAVTAGCDRERRARVPSGTPIVLISIDTLRADRLPAYDYTEVETPAIDALIRDGVLYERAYTHVPLTLPAHASILTGLLPRDHGVRDNLGYRLDAAKHPYLPRLLAAAGYRTGAAVSSFVLDRQSGIGADFHFYQDEIEFVSWSQLGALQRPGTETLELSRDWLQSAAAGPFFFLFHIYEPHSPYAPPEPFASRYPSAYDGEVAWADEIVGRLLEELKRLEVYERSVILLLSDHGEGLGEHGVQEHGPFLYREALQVPLILKLPGQERAGERIAEPAQLIDVLPTLVALLGLEPGGELAGVSLLELEGSRAAPRRILSETFFPRLHFGWSELASVIRYPFHYISGPDPELYDLEQDPSQLRNILQENRPVSRELDAELGRHDRTFVPPGETDAETRRKLAALGYLGSPGAISGEGPLPDPKARIGALRSLNLAFRAFGEGRFEEAEVAFLQVVSEEPQMIDAWEQLGHCRLRLGRPVEALAAYRRAMEVSEGAPHIAVSVANALVSMNLLAEARSYAELAVTTHQSAYDLLAQIALRQGDLEAAERHAARAVAARGARVGPLITQAELRVAQGRLEEALEITRVASQELSSRADADMIKGLFFIRGKAYADLGEARRAEEAFEQEIELFPGELAPYSHLALLFALEGRARESGGALRRMVERNPTAAAYAEAVRTLRVLGDPRSAAALLGQARQRWPDSPELAALAG